MKFSHVQLDMAPSFPSLTNRFGQSLIYLEDVRLFCHEIEKNPSAIGPHLDAVVLVLPWALTSAAPRNENGNLYQFDGLQRTSMMPSRAVFTG